MIKKHFYDYLIAMLLCLAAPSCNKYLDARPDQTLVVPASLDDLQALLDNVQVMNRFYPADGEAATDDFYITDNDYNALVLPQDKTLYPWQADGTVPDGQWLSPYEVVYYANQVLASLVTLNDGSARAAGIRGGALFFRGYAFSQIAALFSKAYDPATASSDPGIPLRLTADFNIRSVRANNAHTWAQVLQDLKASVPLLPVTSEFPSRPTRLAAYAVLARTLLYMRDYAQAGRYADSCLALQPPLMDFNTLNPASPNPIARFNPETIFYAMSNGSTLLVPSRCKVDSQLYASYADGDQRKVVYFKNNGNGSYAFKGNYDGVQGSTIFTGPATDEVYLISAECAARLGNTDQAISTLNHLLVTRWQQGSFQPYSASDPAAALSVILAERRKELILRGTRWTDLKRLNLEQGNEVTLQRKLNGNTYLLRPNDLRYQLLIPQAVISQTGMVQNAR